MVARARYISYLQFRPLGRVWDGSANEGPLLELPVKRVLVS